MATINGSTNSSNYIIWLDAYESNYSIPNNTSTVIVKLYVKRTSGSYPENGGDYSGSIKITYGSGRDDYKSLSFSGTLPYPTPFYENESKLYATLTFTNIPHNNDGSKTVTVSASYGANFIPTSGSASGNLTLTTIPRASTITATSGYIGETSQLTVNRQNNAFTHTIYYSFGNLSGYILADGSTTSTLTKITATSIGFPIPTTWFAEIPNTAQGTCTLTIKTYNGSTQIGSTQTTTFIARVDSSTSSPIVTSSVVDTNQNIIALTGNSNYLVKHYSSASVTWSATAQNDSTISNVTINGISASPSPMVVSVDAGYINVTATDSRGFSTTVNPEFTFKDYDAPTFTFSIERVAPTSSYAYLTFNGVWFNDTFGAVQNTLTLSWKYRKTGDTAWIDGGTFVENTDYKVNGNTFYSGTSSSADRIQIGGNFDYNYGWDIMVQADDVLAGYAPYGSMTKGIPIINWDDDFFNVNGEIRQFNSPIFESDSNIDGTYIKYYDGTMICYKSVSATVAMTAKWGNLYEGSMDLGDWAAEFITVPHIQITNGSPTGAFIESLSPTQTTTYAGKVYLSRPNSYTSTVTVYVMGIGRWK